MSDRLDAGLQAVGGFYPGVSKSLNPIGRKASDSEITKSPQGPMLQVVTHTDWTQNEVLRFQGKKGLDKRDVVHYYWNILNRNDVP